MGRFFEGALLVGLVAAAGSFVDAQTITAEEKVITVGFMNFEKPEKHQGEMLVSALETDGLLQGEESVKCRVVVSSCTLDYSSNISTL